MLWDVIKAAAENWSAHKDSRQGAALAYYSVFSIGPLVVIAIAIAGFVFGRDAVSGQVALTIKDLLGDTGAKAVQAMLVDASRPRAGLLATALGTGALLFAAIGVVVQLKDALNTVWEVNATPGSGLWYYVRSYVLSFAGVLALGFLLLISLLVTTGLAAIGKYTSGYVDASVLHLTNLIVSFGVTTLLFAMMFKWLPDTPIDWYDVWLGAILTTIFFEIGKLAIGFYIGRQGLESTYGAAASVIVLLIWVYYSSQIVLMGAEITHAFARHHGSRRGHPSPDL
ncbi:MAG: YihY/virulence factor BrkB family protein [Bradyrhizobium sp.]